VATSTPPALTEAQRRALALGDELRWCIAVEAAGEQVTIRRGMPGRTLVLRLGELPADDDAELYERAA
jgi:hypothetical protein